MDERENGPVPGILSQDTPSETPTSVPSENEIPPKDDGKIFDSSEYTGVSQESLSFSATGKEKTTGIEKPKGSNPLTKWQFWAITSGVILTVAIVAILVIINIYNGKLASANSIARYDSLLSQIDANKKDFEEKLTEYTKLVYNNNVNTYSLQVSPTTNTDPSKYLYPNDNDIHMAGNNCLKQDIYGLTDEDIAYIETRKTGAELQAEGKNVADEAERLEKINNAYRSASAAIDSCHDPLLDVKLSDFKIELSDATYTENGGKVDVRRNIKVTYKGDKPLKNFSLIYAMQDKNGLTTEYHFMTHTGTDKAIKKGDVIESRVCGYTYSLKTSTDSCVYTTSSENVKAIKALKPKLMMLSGQYPNSWDYK